MTRNISIAALPLVLLAACAEQQPQRHQASVAAENDARAASVAKAASPAIFQAGRWETKTSITSVSATAIDPASKREIVAQESALDQCLPAEEVRRPDANFFAGGDGSECQYSKFEMANGRIDARMNCTATPGTITMKLDGTYTPTSYALNARATTTGVPGAPANTSAKLSGTWIGPCTNPNAQRAPEERGLARGR